MSGNRGNDLDSGTLGCLVFAIIGIVALPFVGIYLITTDKGDSRSKAAGWILLVFGLILWAYLASNGGS